MKILITGGSGFIGSALVRLFIENENYEVLNLDKLTYAGSANNLENIRFNARYNFLHGDICNIDLLDKVFLEFQPDHVFHLAAESHVDRSIDSPAAFINTNIMGSYNLLEAALNYYNKLSNERAEKFRFIHVSTDEVFGSLGMKDKAFNRSTAYDPHSPYSASKAASDHIVKAWYHTYGLPIIITNCSNNYGPFQFPEKFIPLMIINCLQGKPLPIYGNGSNVRDWLHVNDHCRALQLVGNKGTIGQTYMLGGNAEQTNLEIVTCLCQILNKIIPKSDGENYIDLIEYVNDRPGHDLRYAIDTTQTSTEIGWKPLTSLKEGLDNTVKWYLNNMDWWQGILNTNYDGKRLGLNRSPKNRG
ncbi:dTDP-glucose 4,6-dehydratase [Gammaproteobacteria bacterium]|nr:dTDP-glucose 4,6-dehydratase [Gammaproteobacteria bacterium]